MNKIAEYRKALAALIGPPVIVAAGYIANGTPLEAFSSTEWFFVIAAGLGIGGLVAAVPNRDQIIVTEPPNIVGEEAFFDDQDEVVDDPEELDELEEHKADEQAALDAHLAATEVDDTPVGDDYEPRH